VDGQRGVTEHWHTDDQFERQLGSAAQAATVKRRWRIFAAGLDAFRSSPSCPLRVLDAGCGDGINLVGLRRTLEAASRPVDLFAIDISPVRVARARVPGRADGAVACASVTALPFPSSTFDVVLCNHVLEHLTEPARAVAEIVRVLRPSGMAIIGVPNEGSGLARLRNHVLQRSILASTDHVNFFRERTLKSLLEGAGLSVHEVRTGGFFFPHLRVYGWIAGIKAGRWILDAAGRLLPSQSADLIVFATRKSHAESAD
jgi:SAM-dependent methyltransferase